MKIGYTNYDVEEYLDIQRAKRGPIWYIVSAFKEVEWRNFMTAASKGVQAMMGLDLNQRSKVKINALLFQVIQLAKKDGYKDATLIESFINLCGDQINPTMAMLPMGNGDLAVIFIYSRKVIKENMSPRRNIDAGDSM